MALLEVEDLRVHYGKVLAVDSVSFEVEPGEAVAVIGANGAGKSSTLKAIMGLVPVSRGHVEYDGRDFSHRSAWDRARAGIGYVPEGRHVFASLTVEENLRVGGLSESAAVVRRRLGGVYDRFPVLHERRAQRAGTLSGGEQQMLAIGRALMVDPVLLVVDEASLGLMPLNVERAFEAFVELKQAGMSLLIVEQNVTEALAVADRALVMETGRLVLSGTAQEIAEHPDIAAAYLGA